MINANEVIESVMDSFNSMNNKEKLAYLDSIGFEYNVKDEGKAEEAINIKKYNNSSSISSVLIPK